MPTRAFANYATPTHRPERPNAIVARIAGLVGGLRHGEKQGKGRLVLSKTEPEILLSAAMRKRL